MMDISFKAFAIHHLWLLLAATLMPILGIGIYCCLYWQCMDAAIVATIIMGAISYTGAIAWGLFIYYNSWSSEQLQKHINRPIIDIHATLSNKVPLHYQMYEKSEVEQVLSNAVCIHGLKQTQMGNIRYVLVTVTNFGTSILSNICIDNIVIRDNGNAQKQGSYGYISQNYFPKTIGYKEHWDLFVAIDKTIFDNLKEGFKSIDIILRFKYNIMESYYGIVTLNTTGLGTYGLESNIYNEEGYIKLCRNKWYLKNY